jgi:D-alanyl-D-alanine carboxypeptidase (penicillin-binding protein 5/6)
MGNEQTMQMLKKIVKRTTVLILVLLFTLNIFSIPTSAETLYELPANTTISAKAAILVSLGATQQEDLTIYELNADQKRSPAALVRLMVGITAIEIIREKGIDIEKTTGKYSSEAFNTIAGQNLATAGMTFGEEWTIKDLLNLSMIQTAADACATLALTLGGSHNEFVAKMNEITKKIGCENTSFANVSGIDSPSQYTTARDLYKIVRYGMNFPEFEPLFSSVQYTIKPVANGNERVYPNTNDMLRSTTPYYYSPMSFGKTGYTSPAGRCLASVARDSGYEYLCIVMGVPNTDQDGKTGVYFRDTRTLYRWAFNNFTYKTLLNKNQPITQLTVNLAWNKDSVTLVPEKSIAATVINDLQPETVTKNIIRFQESVDAPVEKGQVLGKIELYIQTDRKIGEVNLIAAESIEQSQLLVIWSKIQNFLNSPWFYAGLALLAIIIIAYIILNFIHNRKLRRKRMRRLTRFR